MSAADRMAVRTPDGSIRSVARRVGLAMIARNQAKAAPQQSAPRPGALGRRPSPAAPQTVVSVDGPVTVTAEYDGHTVRVTDVQHEPDVTAQTSGVVDLADQDPAGAPVEFEEDDPTALRIEPPAGERPKGNAGREAWADYARAYGMTITDAMSRNYIRDTVVSMLETDRMSRPAHEGGRPATPEDEPVTEDMVTSADPGERTA